MDVTIDGLNFHEKAYGRKVYTDKQRCFHSLYPPPPSLKVIFYLKFSISVWNHKHKGYLRRKIDTFFVLII